jgi:hypothetical protein
MSILPKILAKIAAESKQDNLRGSPKGFYRGSEIGGCGRAIQYAALKFPAEHHTPEQQLLFDDGHMHHDEVRNLLSRVGTLSCVEMNIQKKYVHGGQKFTLTGTLDCVFDNIVTDIKSISTFRFVGLFKNFPDDYQNYMYQLQMYMDMSGIKDGLFVFKNKDNSELKFIEVAYDPAIVAKALDAVALIHAGIRTGKVTIERPYARDYWLCRYCKFRIPCRKMPMEQRTWPSARTGPAEWRIPLTDSSGSTITPSLVPTLKASIKRKREDL